MPNDLTWQQLADKAPTDSIKLSGGTVTIDVSALTGDAIGSLSDNGVIEALSKLLDFAEKAQTNLNTNLVSPNRLNSLGSSYGAIDDSVSPALITVTRSLSAKIPLNPNSAIGTNY